MAVSLFTGLLLIDWVVALATAALFGSAYILLAFTARKELRINSAKISLASQKQLQALQEGLGAIRDVLLAGNQGIYLEIYRQQDWPQRQLQAKNQFLSAFPRYLVEALGLVAIALLGGLLVVQQGVGTPVIPLLGALALGAQRLLPALQQVYGGWSSLKGFNADMAGVLTMLNQALPLQISVAKPLQMRQSIRFDSVYFRYARSIPTCCPVSIWRFSGRAHWFDR